MHLNLNVSTALPVSHRWRITTSAIHNSSWCGSRMDFKRPPRNCHSCVIDDRILWNPIIVWSFGYFHINCLQEPMLVSTQNQPSRMTKIRRFSLHSICTWQDGDAPSTGKQKSPVGPAIANRFLKLMQKSGVPWRPYLAKLRCQRSMSFKADPCSAPTWPGKTWNWSLDNSPIAHVQQNTVHTTIHPQFMERLHERDCARRTSPCP